jgi:nitrogen regulatory protein PII
MKKIEAVTIPAGLDATRLALERNGICDKLTLTEVQQGGANAASVCTEGGSSGPLQHRIKIELIVRQTKLSTFSCDTHHGFL